MKDFKVLKDIYVYSGPPLMLLKGAKIRLHYVEGHPVLGSIFEDRETHAVIGKTNWREYLRPL